MKTNKREIFGGQYFVECEGLNVGLGDSDADTPVGLYVEIIDMDGATGEPEFKDYPYLVSFELMAANPHPSFAEDVSHAGEPDQLNLIYDAKSYMGGVPVDHTLTLAVNGGIDEIVKLFTPAEAKLVKSRPQYGTYAAQNGPGAEIKYLQFATAEAAERYVDWILQNRAGVLSMMVGFILDRPINMMGETGWNVIERQVRGKNS